MKQPKSLKISLHTNFPQTFSVLFPHKATDVKDCCDERLVKRYSIKGNLRVSHHPSADSHSQYSDDEEFEVVDKIEFARLHHLNDNEANGPQ